jgi:hypothetical protein
VERDVFYGFVNELMHFPRRELFTEDTPAPPSNLSPVVATLRYVWFIIVVGSALTLVRSVLPVHGCLPMLLSYLWCRLQPATMKLNLPFVNAKVSVRSYPLILAGIHFLMGQGIASDFVAILLGHVFCYTMHVRRRERLAVGLRIFDVPLMAYGALRRLHLWQFERMRQQGRIF